MTDTPIDNAKLAVEVLGWKKIPPDGTYYEHLERPDGVGVHANDAPDFAHNLDAAMSLVEPAAKRIDGWFTLEYDSDGHAYESRLEAYKSDKEYYAEAPTPEAAIAEAVWKLVTAK